MQCFPEFTPGLYEKKVCFALVFLQAFSQNSLRSERGKRKVMIRSDTLIEESKRGVFPCWPFPLNGRSKYLDSTLLQEPIYFTPPYSSRGRFIRLCGQAASLRSATGLQRAPSRLLKHLRPISQTHKAF